MPNSDKIPKVKQIPRDQIVLDIANLIEIMPLTIAQIEILWNAILRRKEQDGS